MAKTDAVYEEETLDEQIGRRAHQLMWDRKITQTALGHLIDMDPSSITKRFRGKLGWSATQLVATASALDTTVAYLVGETTEPTVPTQPVGPAGIEPTTSTVKSGRLADILPFERKSA